MPELPDVEVYVEAIAGRTLGATLENVRLTSPFLLRSVEPPLATAFGRKVASVRRLGKRIVIGLEGDLFLVVHLMIAGRLHWSARGAKIPGKRGLAAFDFLTGTMTLTEAGTKRRASLRLVEGAAALRAIDPGGIDVFEIDLERFRTALVSENHTLKRSLTDPRLFSGIGGAYSDEILHRARLSPVTLTSRLSPEEIERLFAACQSVLSEWTARLRSEAAGEFPEGVTAFREGMTVHGRFGNPCPDCGSEVQRIVHADNETNYCPRCQTGGKLLADRALSRLLRSDWPSTIEELEEQGRAERPVSSNARSKPPARNSFRS